MIQPGNAFGDKYRMPFAEDVTAAKFRAVMAHSLGWVVDSRENNLTTMRVAANLEIHPGSVVVIDVFCDIGVVRQEDAGHVGRNIFEGPG